ncbi:hypothetical protein [Marinobacter changyiensis]|uniref:hypothetical protein n=1 Tax=Marinobacter changyiensis TaxID=2604091 RepID=UPI001264F396|nr:hypothetical protein [Marinobacter changyiensis]
MVDLARMCGVLHAAMADKACAVAKNCSNYAFDTDAIEASDLGLLRANIEGRTHPLAALFGFARVK